MFLTRLGFGSKIVVTGDVTQIDLPNGQPSGLRGVQQILDGVEDIADLVEGMVLEGTVSNVAQFGAFVDVGVHQEHEADVHDDERRDEHHQDEVQ